MNESILCVGELLIDFFCNEINVDLQEGQTFTKKAGGAPANVCATISKLGGESHFIGKVGDDPFGKFLENTLNSVGVQTNLLIKDPMHATTLAFVSLREDGQRDFVFHRGADAYLTINDIPLNMVDSMKIVHFGSATALLPGSFRHTYMELLKYAKEKNSFISFDPNFRTDLWINEEDSFVKLVLECVPYCHFLKVSDEELYLLTKERDLEKAVSKLHTFGNFCIAVTLGKEGTFFSNNNQSEVINSILIKAVDTTGAGDAFVGATLFQLSKLHDLSALNFSQWKDIILFSNKVGAIVCEKMGAIEAIPSLEEVHLR